MGTIYDDDPPVYTDADHEMAEARYVGQLITAAEKAGRCVHGSAVAYRNPPVYREQEGLTPGQVRCMDCLTVFATEEDHYRACDAAIYGE